MNLLQGLIRERTVARVSEKPVKLADGVDRRQLLVVRGVLCLVGAVVYQPVSHDRGLAFQRDPGLEGALARDVVEGPLHRDCFDVERLSVVRVFEYLARMLKDVARSDRVPGPVLPAGMGFAEGMWSRIIRLLNLALPGRGN